MTICVSQTYVTEAIQVIWQEIAKAAEAGKFAGICFDDPYSCRQTVWVSYVIGSSVYMGQDQKYEARLWYDIYTACELLSNRFRMDGYSQIVTERRDRRFCYHWQPDRISLTVYFGGRDVHPEGLVYVERCLRRVDELMIRLKEPLDN